MKTFPSSLALFNLGGGEIILILVLLAFFALVTVGFFGVLYLIIRAVQNRPAPVVSALPPEITAQNRQKRDLEQLNLLSIFHFIFAGLAFLGIAFLGLHYLAMHTFFANPELWKSPRGGAPPPPQGILDALVWFYLFGAVILVAALALNLVSGIFLRQKRHRTFSLVIGALDCLQLPFGTAMGVFTIIVLSRDSVRELYDRRLAA